MDLQQSGAIINSIARPETAPQCRRVRRSQHREQPRSYSKATTKRVRQAQSKAPSAGQHDSRTTTTADEQEQERHQRQRRLHRDH